MSNAAIAKPKLLTDPGFLYYAPLGTAVPANTVVASVFSDAWPVAWIMLGMTDAGTKFTPSITVEAITAAETFDPLEYRTTGRDGTVDFALKNFTAATLSKALNGAATVVTGAADTTLTEITPPDPGDEVRCMLGWESLDSTVRFIWFQIINSGDLALDFAKAPANANIPFTAKLEVPALTPPWKAWTAGVERA